MVFKAHWHQNEQIIIYSPKRRANANLRAFLKIMEITKNKKTPPPIGAKSFALELKTAVREGLEPPRSS